MIKEWYTAKELAELELDGMPGTERAYQLKAKKEDWVWRPRKSGKGKEYHVKNLPDAVQIQIIERIVSQGDFKRFALPEDPDKKEKEKASKEKRAVARVTIISLFENFCTGTGMGILKAEQAFVRLYEAEGQKGNFSFAPEWVFEIYSKFSIETLRRWRRIKRSGGGLKELNGNFGKRKGKSVLEQAENGEVASYIVALITKQSHLTAGHVRTLCRAQFGGVLKVKDKAGNEIEKPWPVIRSFERFVCNWQKNNKGLLLNLTDPDSFKNKFQPAFGKADWNVTGLNQVWEIDASPVDAFCTDGRKNLYAIIDLYSKRSMFLVSETPKTEASLMLIRRAVIEWGVPDTIKTDNGSDFVSYRFKNALLALGINQDICSPYTPEGKGSVERVFRTLQHDLMPLLPGFIGHNVSDRSKIEQTKAFSQRLGESDKNLFKIDMTAEQLQKYIDDWSVNVYGARVHGTIKEEPNLRARNWRGAIKKVDNIRVLDVLLAPIGSGKGWRTVTKTGIRAENTTFIAAELALYIGQRVFVRHHPDDFGKIYVFKDETGDFICEAVDPERTNISRKELAQAAKQAQKIAYKEKRKEIKKIQRGIKPYDMVEHVLRAHAKEAANVVDFRAEKEHSSPAITAAQEALNTFTPLEQTPLTPEQQAAHEKTTRELSSSKPEIISLESREGRLARATNLEKRRASGDCISSEDLSWLERYQTRSEWRAHKSVLEEFGSAWFQIGEK